MSDLDVVTVSSRGQVSIPAELRRDLELEEGTKLLVVSRGDSILMRKVDETLVERSVRDILEPMWDDAADAGLDAADAEALVDAHRREG